MASDAESEVPPPANPYERNEPLPSPLDKMTADEPDAPARVRAILESPSHRVAIEDMDFLASDSVRGLRLQMDYLKPELLLRANNVKRTIVVFGSSRLREPAEARRRVEALRAALSMAGGDSEDARRRSPNGFSPTAATMRLRARSAALSPKRTLRAETGRR
jgi:hypothetical protein